MLQRPYWDLHSRWWDRREPEPDLLVLEWLAHLRDRGRPSVLDLGCGTGTLGVALAARGFDVVGLDLSPGMLRRARAKARTPTPGTVAFWRGDLNAPLPFPDGAFDAVLCMAALSVVRNVTGFLGEIRRVLQPGGPLVLKVVRFSDTHRAGDTVSATLFLLGRMLPGWRQRVATCTQEEVARILEGAAFRVVAERVAPGELRVLARTEGAR